MLWSIFIFGILSYYIYSTWISENQKQLIIKKKEIIAQYDDIIYQRHAIYQTVYYSIRVCFLFFIIGFIVEYWNHYKLIQANIEVYKLRQPPVNCGLNSITLEQLSYWKQLKIGFNWENPEQECLFYLSKLHQSPYPNPIQILIEMSTNLILSPIRIIVSHLSLGWFWNSMILMIIILSFVYVYGTSLFFMITHLFSNLFTTSSTPTKTINTTTMIEDVTEPKQPPVWYKVTYKDPYELITNPTDSYEMIRNKEVKEQKKEEKTEIKTSPEVEEEDLVAKRKKRMEELTKNWLNAS